MDIIICIALLVIAGSLYHGKTFKIEITHKHEVNTSTQTESPEQVKDEDQPTVNLDPVIKTIQEIMGVTDSERKDQEN